MERVLVEWNRRRVAALALAFAAGVEIEWTQLHAWWGVVGLLAIATGIGLAVYDVRKGARDGR